MQLGPSCMRAIAAPFSSPRFPPRCLHPALSPVESPTKIAMDAERSDRTGNHGQAIFRH